MTITADVRGGPGWIIRGSDLRPEIVDLNAFRDGLTDDPLATVIELLWTGKADEALDLLRQEPQSVRVRALSADCLRDLGDLDAANAIYDELVAECAGTGREAFMHQHRGKARLASGRLEEAVADFEHAVKLRLGGDPDLLASAGQALAVALQRLNG